MANVAQVTKLVQGSHVVVLHVYLKGDGAAAELSGQVLLDPVDIGGESVPSFTVEEITHSLEDGMSACLEYETGLGENQPIWVLSQQDSICFDVGIADRSGVDGTGKLLVSTKGMNSVGGKQGSVVIRLRRK
jgi:hypothetical protein